MRRSKDPKRPEATSEGWKLGSGSLPRPKEPDILWKLIARIIDERREGVLVLAHHNADLDAVGTAIILKEAFPWVDIGAYRSISNPGRKLLDSLETNMAIDPAITDYSLVVVVDASSPLQVSEGDLSSWPEYWIVDHHMDHEHWSGNLHIDPEMGACVEIAIQIALMSGAELNEKMVKSALAGIIADTGKFRFAKELDMSASSMLLGTDMTSMEEVMGTIEGQEYFDVSKKIAQLKAMRRLRYRKVGDQIIATSKVSTFEAAAARSMLVAGADVVFVGSDRKKELRISTRAKPHILALGVHLGKFMEDIGSITGNQGGGHDGAAGLNGKGRADRVLQLCMDRMEDVLAERTGIELKNKR